MLRLQTPPRCRPTRGARTTPCSMRALLCIAASTACSTCTDDPRASLEVQLRQLRARGYATSRAELFSSPDPKEDNGAHLLLEAHRLERELRTPVTDNLVHSIQADRVRTWTDEQWRSLSDIVEDLEPVVQLLDQALSGPAFKVRTDALRTTTLVDVLALRALLLGNRGDWKMAADSARDQLALLACIDRRAEASFVARLQIFHGFVRTVRILAEAPALDVNTLMEAIGFQLSEIEVMVTCDFTFELESYLVWTLESSTVTERERHDRVRSISGVLDVLERLTRDGKTSPLASDFADVAMSPARDLALKLIESHLDAVTESRLTRVGLAALRRKRRSGQWPGDLEELAGELGSSVLRDPRSGERVRLETLVKGIRIKTTAESQGRDLVWELVE